MQKNRCYLYYICEVKMNKNEFSEQYELLKAKLKDRLAFDSAIKQCLDIHGSLHSASVSGTSEKTYEDELLDGLEPSMYSLMPLKRDATIAWCLWHITRIEDITSNILIADKPQIFSTGDLKNKINATAIDTGNIMTDEEIVSFSEQLNIKELLRYREAVGRNTREIILSLTPDDLKRKTNKTSLRRILDEGAVLDEEGANWLIGFWGGKTVAGLLLMPITKHLHMHLQEAMRIKTKLLKVNK